MAQTCLGRFAIGWNVPMYLESNSKGGRFGERYILGEGVERQGMTEDQKVEFRMGEWAGGRENNKGGGRLHTAQSSNLSDSSRPLSWFSK